MLMSLHYLAMTVTFILYIFVLSSCLTTCCRPFPLWQLLLAHVVLLDMRKICKMGTGLKLLPQLDTDNFLRKHFIQIILSSLNKIIYSLKIKLRYLMSLVKQVKQRVTVQIFYRKDDEELKVGASLSKMIVPHPALQSFIAVEILYTAYSGWISSGLAKWSIDKISLMDTFGKR